MESVEDAQRIDDQWAEFRSRGDVHSAGRDVRTLFELLATYEQQSSDPAPKFAAELRNSLIPRSTSSVPASAKPRHLGIVNIDPAPYPAPRRSGLVFVVAIALVILAAAVLLGLDLASSDRAGLSLATLQAETVQLTQTAMAGESTATVSIES